MLVLDEDLAAEAREAVQGQINIVDGRLDKITGVSAGELEQAVETENGLPLFHGGRVAGLMRTAHHQDASLYADVLLENLACKATAAAGAA
ncbi:MAG: hypothetical protein ACE5H9_07890 [Anaerolineae bacterium]